MTGLPTPPGPPLRLTLDPLAVSLVPTRCATPAAALAAMDRDGASILTGLGTGAGDATAAARAVLGERAAAVPDPVPVHEKGGEDRARPGLGYDNLQPAHTDGYAYGDQFPDVVLLHCVRQSAVGGESLLVDGYALLAQLAAGDDDARALHHLLTTTPIDQTEPGFQPAISRVVQRTPAGRTVMRRTLDQRADPRATAVEQARQNRLVAGWHELLERISWEVLTCKLAPGEALCIDNYRMMHGRRSFAFEERFMWRTWVWTDRCQELPSLPTFSDSRYALMGGR